MPGIDRRESVYNDVMPRAHAPRLALSCLAAALVALACDADASKKEVVEAKVGADAEVDDVDAAAEGNGDTASVGVIAKAKLDLWKAKPMDDAANTPMVPDEWLAKGQTTATVDMKRAIRNIQAILNMNGFDAGKADGEMGKKTIAAIKAFQKSIGQEPTGRIDDALVKELLKRNKKS